MRTGRNRPGRQLLAQRGVHVQADTALGRLHVGPARCGAACVDRQRVRSDAGPGHGSRVAGTGARPLPRGLLRMRLPRPVGPEGHAGHQAATRATADADAHARSLGSARRLGLPVAHVELPGQAGAAGRTPRESSIAGEPRPARLAAAHSPVPARATPAEPADTDRFRRRLRACSRRFATWQRTITSASRPTRSRRPAG